LTASLIAGNLCRMSPFLRTIAFRLRQRSLAPALEGLVAVDDRLQRLDARITELDGRMQMVGVRLDDLNRKLDHLEEMSRGLAEMGGQLEKIDGRLSEVQDLMQVVVARAAASTERAITILEGAARNERRLEELERALGAR
jgi:DNA anti-recombination protein RmuC